MQQESSEIRSGEQNLFRQLSPWRRPDCFLRRRQVSLQKIVALKNSLLENSCPPTSLLDSRATSRTDVHRAVLNCLTIAIQHPPGVVSIQRQSGCTQTD